MRARFSSGRGKNAPFFEAGLLSLFSSGGKKKGGRNELRALLTRGMGSRPIPPCIPKEGKGKN